MLIDGKAAVVFRTVVHPNVTAVYTKNTETSKCCTYTIGGCSNDQETIAYVFGSKDSAKQIVLCGYGNYTKDNIVLDYIIEHRHAEILPFDIYTRLRDYEREKGDEKYELHKNFFSLDLKHILLPEKQRLSFVQIAYYLNMSVPKFVSDLEPIDESMVKQSDEITIVEKVLDLCKDKIVTRCNLYRDYKINAMTVDDTLMGIRYITNRYLDKTKEKFDSFTSKRTPLQKFRPRIYCHSCNNLNFELSNFAAELLDQTINPAVSWSKQIKFRNLILSAGTGGVRSINQPKEYICKDTEVIIHIDITSMFPTTMVNNDLFPRHLSNDFKELYASIRKRRIEAKSKGNEALSKFLKNTLNAAIGLMNSDWSYMYDPAMFTAIRIQAMLYSLGLLEKVAIFSKEIIQVNVDGIFVLVENDNIGHLEEAVYRYTEREKLDVKMIFYTMMYQYSVNDYIAVKLLYDTSINNNIVKKGLFSCDEMSRVLKPKAVIEAITNKLLNGIPPKTTIEAKLNRNELKDFLLSTNIGTNFTVVHNGKTIGNSPRYYYSSSPMSGYLMRNGKDKIDSLSGVEIVNDIHDIVKDKINVFSYVGLANKIIMAFQQNKTLF